MTFVIILLALFIDRVLWDASPYRRFLWFGDYRQRLQQLPWVGQALTRNWGALLIIGLPVAACGWLQWSLLPHFGNLLEFAFGLAVLLLGLGPQELGRSLDDYHACIRSGNQAGADRLARELGASGPGDAVAHAALSEACRRLIGPLAWFVAFGASGVLLYRLAHLLRDELSESDRAFPLRVGADNLVRVLDWLPVRLTALGYAVAGNFNAVAAAWKHCNQIPEACPNDQSLLQTVGAAALENGHDNSPGGLIDDARTLIWRNLGLWVIFLGAVTLFSL